MSYPKLISVPDEGIYLAIERALRERIGTAHHSACMIRLNSSASRLDIAKLDLEYETAVETYRIITGIDPIAGRPQYDAIVAERLAKQADEEAAQ